MGDRHAIQSPPPAEFQEFIAFNSEFTESDFELLMANLSL
jgi:hypothetical protein